MESLRLTFGLVRLTLKFLRLTCAQQAYQEILEARHDVIKAFTVHEVLRFTQESLGALVGVVKTHSGVIEANHGPWGIP
jgi:hypothetical protein